MLALDKKTPADECCPLCPEDEATAASLKNDRSQLVPWGLSSMVLTKTLERESGWISQLIKVANDLILRHFARIETDVLHLIG